jgi:hypothetical protein
MQQTTKREICTNSEFANNSIQLIGILLTKDETKWTSSDSRHNSSEQALIPENSIGVYCLIMQKKNHQRWLKLPIKCNRSCITQYSDIRSALLNTSRMNHAMRTILSSVHIINGIFHYLPFNVPPT